MGVSTVSSPLSTQRNPQSYERLFRDVRKCVDLCHRDGVIKDRVAEDPAKYIIPDPDMAPMLKRFRKEGVQASVDDYTMSAHGT